MPDAAVHRRGKEVSEIPAPWQDGAVWASRTIGVLQLKLSQVAPSPIIAMGKRDLTCERD